MILTENLYLIEFYLFLFGAIPFGRYPLAYQYLLLSSRHTIYSKKSIIFKSNSENRFSNLYGGMASITELPQFSAYFNSNIWKYIKFAFYAVLIGEIPGCSISFDASCGNIVGSAILY